MAFKMKAGKEGPMKKNFPSVFKKDPPFIPEKRETETDIGPKQKPQEGLSATPAEKLPAKAKNWNKKLTRLVNKRTKRKEKGKDTSRVQKRINKEMKKIGN